MCAGRTAAALLRTRKMPTLCAVKIRLTRLVRSSLAHGFLIATLISLESFAGATDEISPLTAMFAMPDGSGAAATVEVDYLTPPGDLFDIGSHKLHLYCVGSGQPTVLLEAGLGGFSLEWVTIQQMLGNEFRACSYDRAGYGWSEFGPNPRTTDQIVDELARLLRAADEPPPYLLVGHSFGGYVVQAYLRSRPRDVAGIVLVDSSHPEQDRYLPPPPPVQPRMSGARVRMVSRPTLPNHYPREVRNLAYHLMGTRKSSRTQREELRFMRKSGRRVLEAGNPPPEVPVAVVARAFYVDPGDGSNGHSTQDDLERIWQSLQENLGHLYRVETIRAQHSGHFVHLDQPWLIIDTIKDVISASCKRSGCVLSEQEVMAAERCAWVEPRHCL